MSKKKKVKKANNVIIDQRFLKHRADMCQGAGFPKQKWVEFCEVMMEAGYTITLYEARQTVSKYITVSNGYKKFVVRFSNHAPILRREIAGDCDFFVGRTHLGVSTTAQAIFATKQFMEPKEFII